ncbi:MAG: hypothetical protein AAF809_14695 [Bacteroidota bacterium]
MTRLLLALFVALVGCASDPVRIPPAPPTGLALRALEAPAFTWRPLSGDTVTIYTQPGSYADRHAAALFERSEHAYAYVLDALGEAPQRHVRVFYVGSRAEMARLTGQERGAIGITDPASPTILLVVNEDEPEPVERHEFVHAVTVQHWGQIGSPTSAAAWRRETWLREGLATALGNTCQGATVRATAAALVTAGDGLPLDTLVHDFYSHDDLDTYLLSGSAVAYLLETHGLARLRTLWTGGSATIEEVYARSLAEIERGWQAWLTATPVAARPDLAVIREHGC